MKETIRNWLRAQPSWIRFRELNREGWARAVRRRYYQRQILNTRPLRTSSAGPVEVRVLTWRKDWINLIWALKSFYHFSAVDYPLHIHDGGLLPSQTQALLRHFPDARMHTAAGFDALVEQELRRRELFRSAEYRRLNVSTRKVWDFFLFSNAERILTIDSDIVFFRRPDELLEGYASSGSPVNRYNRDATMFYSMTPEEIKSAFDVEVPPLVNSGLGSVWRESMNFEQIEQWLHHPKLFADRWVTEQTLHAMCSAAYGLEILPDAYMLGRGAGLLPTAICKHYVSDPRPLLYSEGMRTLIQRGFLHSMPSSPPPLRIPQRIRRRLKYYRQVIFWEKVVVERCLPAILPLTYPPRHRRCPDPATVKSVLVWNIDSFGDLLWTTPTLRALRAGYPLAKITMICNQSTRELLETNPHIDRLLPVKAPSFYEGRGLFAPIEELKDQSFDVMVILEMGSRPAEAARLLSRRLNVGYSVSTELGLLKKLADYTLPTNSPRAPEYWPAYFLKTIAHLGLSVPPPILEVFRTDEDREAIRKWLREVSADGQDLPLIGFHPCVAPYANLTKKWPQEHFVELAVLLLAKGRARIVLTGSADERAECEVLADKIRSATGAPVIVTAGDFGPRRLVELLSAMKLVVVADTAVLHFAAAAGTPTIGLFGATDLSMIAPRNANCIALSENLPCSPCHQNRDRMPFWPKCIFARQECMYGLSPTRVAAEAQRLIETMGAANGRIPLPVVAHLGGS